MERTNGAPRSWQLSHAVSISARLHGSGKGNKALLLALDPALRRAQSLARRFGANGGWRGGPSLIISYQ